MKPILFNTEMVRAILDGRKTVTRRVVKPQPKGHAALLRTDFGENTVYTFEDGTVTSPHHRPGEILYVREKWRIVDYLDRESLKFEYAADGKISDFIDFTNDRIKKFLKYISRKSWCPKIFMPREVARIFLRVTDVRVARLQEITELDILEKEGVTVDFPQPKPSYMSLAYTETRLKPAVRKAFADLWDSTIKPADRAIYGWNANPLVWVIAFEKISKEEAMRA